ncbi:MAG: response regulator [Candidatus Latescibacterota bacterium]|nr:response regulator [Candidatus Latescibacterota bacterium]
MIAEDEALMRTRLEAQLKAWDFDVVSYADGQQAWYILSSEDSPRLALLDWMMPGADGVDLCRAIRELNHGPLMYLTKPWNAGELKARLQVGVRVLALQEQLMEAERDRAALQTAGAAAHEISQPLLVMLGNIEMLIEDLGDDPDALELLQMSYSAGTRINEIVQQMKSMRQAVTKPYLEGIEIIDFEESSE